MNCPNCGSPLRNDAKFCPVCGGEIVYNQTPPVERSVVDGHGTENKALKITLIVLISLIAAIIIGVGVYFLVNHISSNDEPAVSICEECGDEFEGSGDLCDDCKQEKEKNKDNKKDDSEDDGEDKRLNEKECNQCHSELNTEGLLCSECLREINSREYSSGYVCKMCGDRISEKEIAIVDGFGFVYCEFCDEGLYCDGCNAPLSKNDDDTECYNCAEHVCYSCNEVLADYESEGTDSYGNEYCKDCYSEVSANTCNQCGDKHNNRGLLCDSCLAKIDKAYYSEGYSCFWCEKDISKDQIAIVDYEGLVYCQDCDNGKYCAGCYAPLSLENSSGYCGYCN